MAIKLDILKDRKNADAYRKFSYADLRLDLDLNSHIPSTPVGIGKNAIDFRLSYDENAIFNSIKNIFNTKKGQKILNPTFGLDLEEFLFDKILFFDLLQFYHQHGSCLFFHLNNYIDFDRKFEKWDLINQAIIISILSELSFTVKEKIKIVLNDYLNVAKNFVPINEVKMINAVVDKYLNDKQIL